MKVALVGRYSLPLPLSEHGLDFPLLKHWSEQMEELHLLVEGRRANADQWTDGHLIVHYAPRRITSSGPVAFVLWVLRRLQDIRRTSGLDIVNGSDLWGGLAGVLFKRSNPVKVIAQLQGEFLPPSPFAHGLLSRLVLGYVARYASRRADLVRCLYQRAASNVRALGVPPAKIRIIPSRCDTSLFDPRRFPRNDRRNTRILFVGNVSIAKGVGTLIRSFAEFANVADATLTLVGEGPDTSSLSLLADRLGVSGRIRFLGRIPHEGVPDAMHQADLFVFPSFSEATPRAIMEAMAMELPVIATRVGGIPEIVDEGRTGLLVPPARPKALAQAIVWALGNPPWCETAGRLGRERVLRCFTVERHLSDMLAMHTELMTSMNAVSFSGLTATSANEQT